MKTKNYASVYAGLAICTLVFANQRAQAECAGDYLVCVGCNKNVLQAALEAGENCWQSCFAQCVAPHILIHSQPYVCAPAGSSSINGATFQEDHNVKLPGGHSVNIKKGDPHPLGPIPAGSQQCVIAEIDCDCSYQAVQFDTSD